MGRGWDNVEWFSGRYRKIYQRRTRIFSGWSMERSWACKDLKEILRHAEKSLRPTQQIKEVNSQHKDYVLDIVTAMFHSIL